MRRIRIILCLLAGLLPLGSLANQVFAEPLDSLSRADSLSAADSVPAWKKRPSSIDISKYAMQKRWRPADEKAPSGLGWLLNDAYVYAYGSYLKQFVSQYGPGACGQIGYGKWFSDANGLHRYHGMRLGMSAGWSYDNFDASRIHAIEARATYLFDLSAFASGYDPRRLFSFVPQVGVGLSFVDGEHRKYENAAFSMHMGLDWVVHSFPGVDVVLEPLFELHADPRRLPRQNVWKTFIPAFRGSVGVHVQMDRSYWNKQSDPGKDLRVSLAAGPALQVAPNIRSAKEVLRLMGYTLALGFGRSYNDWFDWRFQLGQTTDWWFENRQDVYSRDLRSAASLYLRLDAMFDIPAMFRAPSSDGRRFRFFVLAGPELGLLHKSDVANLEMFPYLGLSGGLQFRWEPWRDFAFFVEPRVSAVPYTTRSNMLQVDFSNYSDLVTSLYVGIEYRLPTVAGRRGSSGRTYEGFYAEAREHSPRVDRPWNISVFGGAQIIPSHLVQRDLRRALGSSWALGVSRPLLGGFSWRTQLGISFSGFPYEGSVVAFRSYCARLEAMYDFLSLAKIAPERKVVSFSLFAGPEMGFRSKHEDLFSYCGVSAGAQIKARVIPWMSLFLEGRASVVPEAIPVAAGLGIEFHLGR
ncbi:MAG: hypothetical protein J6X69_08880 [Bacteroidales bacterium]|nr:hypothetical protein [Bacteroidales bacterium]